jgi:CBS domain-containing protein
MSAVVAFDPIETLLDAARPVLFGTVACESVGSSEGGIEAAAPGESLREVVGRMWWRKVGALPVLEGGRLVGALAEDDLLHILADRLRERADAVAAIGDDLVIWESLLEDTTVRDAMTPLAELAAVRAGTSLLAAIETTFGPTATRRRKSYLFALDENGAPLRVISFRDIARHLVRLYDGETPASAAAKPALHAGERRLAWSVLDLSLGTLLARGRLGSKPESLGDDAGAPETIARMVDQALGYAIVAAKGGVLRGICTRHDVLDALKNPFVRLEALRAARLMSEPVKTVSEVDTLCGLFKMMAIEGFRHMPLVDDDDRVTRVISMWQGIGVLAHGPQESR